MAKEALFNILNNNYYFEDIRVLDLFSGTGNISFEFASRGVKTIVSVDAHAGCIQFIEKTSTELNFEINTIKSDVFKYLERSKNNFDIVFADPPYDIEIAEFSKIVTLVFSNELISDDGVLVIEHSEQTNLSELAYFKEKRKYGSSIFSFFEKN